MDGVPKNTNAAYDAPRNKQKRRTTYQKVGGRKKGEEIILPLTLGIEKRDEGLFRYIRPKLC
jgi:hypothetical protein